MVKVGKNEIVIALPWGGTLRCGEGEDYAHGGYVRVCDKRGRELPLCYWDKQEWADDPELVMGAIFASTQKTVHISRKKAR